MTGLGYLAGIQLRPAYDGPAPITLDGDPSAIGGPTIRQRERLVDVLGRFTDEQWAQASRCEGWSARDVIVHLDSTNGFWAFSIARGLKGEPTRFMATFDPVASPAQLVADAPEAAPAQALEAFAASTAALNDLLASLDDAAWATTAESPPGHVSVSTLAHHALWDSWVHERDILLPLGLTPVEEADEIAACLRYGAALSPAFARNNGSTATGTLAVVAGDPNVECVVEVGDQVRVRSGAAMAPDLTLAGNAVDLVEAFSIRRPLDQEVPPEAAWLVEGLARVFDAA